MKLFLEVCFKNLFYFFSNAHYRTFYLLLLKIGGKKRYQSLNVSVNSYHLQVPDTLSFIWQYKEIFVDESYKFDSPNTRPLIIDCGANIGLSGIYFKKLYPEAKLYCIEADPGIAQVLQKNFIQNNIGAEVIAKAAWINNEGVSFNSEGSDGGSIGTDTSGKVVKIESIDLNQFMLSFERIDFLKMDIEGAENTLIPACKEGLKRVDKLFLEYHSSYKEQQHLPELLQVLKDSGFHFYLKNENKRKAPFVNLHKERAYDLQLNIYAYRKD